MLRLHFKYEMVIEYSVPVAKCNFTIKCIPEDNKRQLIDNVNIELTPATRYKYGKDGFNNTQIYGLNSKPHKMFKFFIEGDATTGMSDYEALTNENLDMIFKHPHGLNVAGENIKKYYQSHSFSEEADDYKRAVLMMHELFKYMIYEPCSTNTWTSAEEAFSQGKGVCQDYAHILIALLHLASIPARYVTGLIVGEGASHAWVEVLIDSKWYGIDPTNDKIVSDEHIKIGVGRDANDCQINRGIMHGGGLHIQTITVQVNEVCEDD